MAVTGLKTVQFFVKVFYNTHTPVITVTTDVTGAYSRLNNYILCIINIFSHYVTFSKCRL